MIGTHRYTVALDTKDLAKMATDERLKFDVEHDEVIELSVSGSQFEEVIERAKFERGTLVEWDEKKSLPR